MKIKILSIFLFAMTMSLQAQEVPGEWKMYNEQTGEVRSIVKVFKKNDTLYGRVLRIMDEKNRDDLCVKCNGEDKNKKIEGLVLLKDFVKEGDAYVDGTITNPDNGKVYTSKIWMDKNNPNLLNIRGYIGIFYKTLTWERVEEKNP